MDEFSKIEERFKRAPMHLVDHAGATGVLRLRGRKSRLEVSTDSFLHFQADDDNGWYDIRARSSDGADILLHHAITLSSGTHRRSPSGADAHTLSIFPNVLVDDVRGLTDDREVQRIQFRLRGLNNFFYYRHAESLRGFDATAEQIEALNSMRYTPDREDGPFAPREIYVIHDFPMLLKFRVRDRVYDVWSGGRFSGLNWDRVHARTYPIATISFDHPVSVDVALERAWEWRRLFAQMAMMQLPFEAISVRPTLDERASSANLYLPNLKRRPRPIKGRYAPSPRHLALNSWNDREQLGEVMRSWLERDDSRGHFRARLDRVIERMNRRLDPTDLLELGSAVESLAELGAASPFPTGTLNAMVDAAHAAAERQGASIPRERLSGVLGNLQRPSLASRFSSLGARLPLPISAEDATLLVRSATQARNASAHGHVLSDQVQPRIAPTVEALAALCARFDLETCGFPSRSSADARTMSKLRFDEALEHLRALDADTKPG